MGNPPDENPFALSLRHGVSPGGSALTPFSAGDAPTPEEEWIREETRQHAAMIEGMTKKSEYGLASMRDVNVFASAVYSHGMETIMQVRDGRARPEEAQRYMDNFTEVLLKNFGTQMLDGTHLAATKIARAMDASLHPPANLEERKSLLQKLFGR